MWFRCKNPVRGFLIADIEEPCLDGVAKISVRIVGSYRVVNENTVHAQIFDESEKTILHDVFLNVIQAEIFILKNVLSQATLLAEIAEAKEEIYEANFASTV